MDKSPDQSQTPRPQVSQAQEPQVQGQFMHERQPSADADRDLFGNVPKRHPDWEHRRGEPRLFTFLWMIYLMGATVLMFSSMGQAYSISSSISRPAARMMMLMVVLGWSVLWPMVRFSQQVSAQPGGYVRSSIREGLVLFLPMQAVIWPQMMSILAGWSFEVVVAISVMCFAWMSVLAGVVSLGLASIERNQGREFVRVLWMLVVMLIVFAAPVFVGLGVVEGQAGLDVDRARVGWLLSPMTGLLEIVRDRSALGINAAVYGDHWRVLIALFCVGSALVLIARALELARARYAA